MEAQRDSGLLLELKVVRGSTGTWYLPQDPLSSTHLCLMAGRHKGHRCHYTTVLFPVAIKQERPLLRTKLPQNLSLVHRPRGGPVAFHQLQIQTFMFSSESIGRRHRQKCPVRGAPMHIPASHNLWNDIRMPQWSTLRWRLPEGRWQGNVFSSHLGTRRRTRAFLKLPQAFMGVETGQISPFCATRAPSLPITGLAYWPVPWRQTQVSGPLRSVWYGHYGKHCRCPDDSAGDQPQGDADG